jgi:hypothetical protein
MVCVPATAERARPRPRPTIFDFREGTAYRVREVAELFGYNPATVRGWILNGNLRATTVPFSGVRIRRANPAKGRCEYRIDGIEVLRLWGEMKLNAARELEATPTAIDTVDAAATTTKRKIQAAFTRIQQLRKEGR